jgi:hypothetical protein
MSRTRPFLFPPLTVLALVAAVLFLAVLLVTLAVLPRSGHSTPAHCPTAPTRAATAKQLPSTHPCTSHTTPGTASHRGTPGTRLPASAKIKSSGATVPKAPAAAPKVRR